MSRGRRESTALHVAPPAAGQRARRSARPDRIRLPRAPAAGPAPCPNRPSRLASSRRNRSPNAASQSRAKVVLPASVSVPRTMRSDMGEGVRDGLREADQDGRLVVGVDRDAQPGRPGRRRSAAGWPGRRSPAREAGSPRPPPARRRRRRPARCTRCRAASRRVRRALTGIEPPSRAAAAVERGRLCTRGRPSSHHAPTAGRQRRREDQMPAAIRQVFLQQASTRRCRRPVDAERLAAGVDGRQHA